MTYNYQKILFRRPFFTEMNVMFLWFLLLSAVMIGSLTIVSYRLVRGISVNNLNGYMTMIEIIKQPISNDEYLKTYSEMVNINFSGGQFIFPEVSASSINEKNISETAVDKTPSVLAAINNISTQAAKHPPLKYSPIKNLRKKADVYKLNTGFYTPSKTNQNKVNIQQPNFTDFEVVKGYRDHEEVISIANGNTKFVKLCIEKYNKKYSIRGNVEVKYSIHPDGYVIPESIKVLNTDIDDPRIINCIKRNMQRWRNFPQVAVEFGEYSITQKYIF